MNMNMLGKDSSNKCAGKENYTHKKLESSKRQIYIKNVAIGRLTRSWNFCFDDSSMHAQNNAGKMTANLLDLQEIPFHRVGHYHNYFIITDSEEHIN